jgi:phosphopantothenoylcysteine decarboxylase/phosphopantothenate--cysteine ligase
LAVPAGVTMLPVLTAREMYDAVMAHIANQQIFIAVAAVADWRVEASDQKIKKQHGIAPELKFEQNPDILATVAALPAAPYCVGFAAESENLLVHGRAKREKKNIPLLVGNIGHQTFGKDDNELVLFDAAGHQHLPRADKAALAQSLIVEIARRIQ